jgi:hypothetical protein
VTRLGGNKKTTHDMELKDYIKETLTQIIQGVSEAQKFAAENNSKINPSNVQLFYKGDNPIYSDKNNNNYAQIIDFDIAITVTEGNNNKGGVGVFFGTFGAGGQIENQQMNSNVNRIKFSVPVFLPKQ